MGISLAGLKMQGEKIAASEKIQKEFGKQQKKSKKRGLFSKILGTGAGKLLGSAAVGALGLTGFGVPIAMALGQFAGKKLSHEATKGMAADPSKIKAGKYGLGAASVAKGRESLKQQQDALDPFKQRGGFGAELLGATAAAGLAGDLGGATKSLMEGDIGKAFVDPKAVGGWAGAKQEIGSLIPGFGGASTDPEASLLSTEIGESSIIPGGGGSMDTLIPEDQLAGLNMPEVSSDILEEGEGFFAQGGLVQNQQQQLMQMIALQKLLNPTTYDNTALEEVGQPTPNGASQGEQQQQQTIADIFSAQGKTLGGSNTKSLSQMLGKR